MKRFRIQWQGYDTGLPLAVSRMVKQDPVAFHDHQFTELVIILTGSCQQRTDHGVWRVAAGDVFVIHQGIAHEYFDTEDVSLINILFDLKLLGVPLFDLDRLPGYHTLFTVEPRLRRQNRTDGRLKLSMEDVAQVDRLTQRMERELQQRQDGYQFTAVGVFMQLLSFLSRAYSRMEEPENNELIRLGEVLSHLENHFSEPMQIQELARMAHMSESTFTRTFRRALDSSPIDYLIRIRIRRASELLQSTDLPISEIAEKTGFRDGNYFARQFRQVVKLTPSQFRGHARQLTGD